MLVRRREDESLRNSGGEANECSLSTKLPVLGHLSPHNQDLPLFPIFLGRGFVDNVALLQAQLMVVAFEVCRVLSLYSLLKRVPEKGSY